MRLTVLLASMLATFVAVFAVQNSIATTVAFLAWRLESSLAVVLLITFSLGIACMALVEAPARVRHRLDSRRQRRLIETLQAKIGDLTSRLEVETSKMSAGRVLDTDKPLIESASEDLPKRSHGSEPSGSA